MSRRGDATEQRTVTMGNAFHQERQNSQVEIIDDEDDEVEEITRQVASVTSDRASRLITRRQRRHTAFHMPFSSEDRVDDDNWDQLQEVLLMSKLEAEKQEERRKMCGTLQDVMNLQVEIEPMSSGILKNHTAETTKSNKSNDEDQMESSASPELFSTPPEEQEQPSSVKASENIESDKEFPVSPSLPVTMRSPDADRVDRDGKLTVSTDKREENVEETKKPKLRRTRKEVSCSMEPIDKAFNDELKATAFEINNGLQDGISMAVQAEKRKLEVGKSDDDTDEDDVPLRRRRMSLKRKKLAILEEESDTDEVQGMEVRSSKRIPDDHDDPQPKRTAFDHETPLNGKSTPKGKEPVAESRQQRTSPGLLHVRLSRRYKKTRGQPSTLKEAMRSNLYFAPQGFDFSAYTPLIIRMFEKYKQRLHAAQSKVKTKIPWGDPVVCGKSQEKTLDVLSPGKASAVVGGKSSLFVKGTPRIEFKAHFDQDVSNRRRTLRSSGIPPNQAVASTSGAGSHKTLQSYKVDSDSDGEELMTSYLDKIMPPSGISSSKKSQQSVQTDGISEKVFAEACKLTSDALEETSIKMQTSTHSSVRGADHDRTSDFQGPFNDSDTDTSAKNYPGSLLFGVDVVLDSNTSEMPWNSSNPSNQKRLQNEKQAMNESKTEENGLDSENSGSKGGGLTESTNGTGENQSDVIIQPPKHRSISRLFDDYSTDDESSFSQPVFSQSLPHKEASADQEVSLATEKTNTEFSSFTGGEKNDILDDVIPLDSQSLITRSQSESQGILGKSVLETMATDGETMLPSQALTETQPSSQERMTETLEGSGAIGHSSSTVKHGAEGGRRKRFTPDDEFTIDVDRDDNRHVRQKRTEAIEKAAAAAMKRQQTIGGGGRRGDLSEACSSSSTISEPVQADTIECPLCYHCFSAKEIEAHASDCQGLSSSAQASHSHSQRTGQPVSSSPRAKPKLKNLKVVLQRSPLAKEKLLQRANQETDSTRENLDFEENFKSSGKPDRYVRPFASSSRSFNQGSRTHGRDNRAALRTESDSDPIGFENKKEDDGSEVYSWLDSTSPEMKKTRLTYGGSTSKLCADSTPLNTATGSEDDEVSTGKSFKQDDSKQATSSRTEEIECDSDSSDDDALMVHYGARRTSTRRQTETRRSKTADMNENELALEQSGSRFKKRVLPLSTNSKAKRPRRMSDSGSDDSDELTMVCHLCNKKIPKEFYERHAEEELEERRRAESSVKPNEEEVVIVKQKEQRSSKLDQRRFTARLRAREDTPPSQSSGRDSDQNEHEIDWDAVSNSPIKCFQFTENSTSAVDFDNQFEHLRDSKGGRRRGTAAKHGRSGTRRRYGHSDTGAEYSNSRGHGECGEVDNRGRNKKVYGRGRGKYCGRKFRGYRKKK